MFLWSIGLFKKIHTDHSAAAFNAESSYITRHVRGKFVLQETILLHVFVVDWSVQ